MWPFRRRAKQEKDDIIARYTRLVDAGRFREALPVIREIVARAPHVPTSLFNLGVCLSELGRHQEAADAFLDAYRLAPEDGGALYRACVALARAGDGDRLYRVAKRECEINPAMIYNFLEEELFKPFFAQPKFARLRERYDVRGDA